jgi:hypothetical protein
MVPILPVGRGKERREENLEREIDKAKFRWVKRVALNCFRHRVFHPAKGSRRKCKYQSKVESC